MTADRNGAFTVTHFAAQRLGLLHRAVTRGEKPCIQGHPGVLVMMNQDSKRDHELPCCECVVDALQNHCLNGTTELAGRQKSRQHFQSRKLGRGGSLWQGKHKSFRSP